MRHPTPAATGSPVPAAPPTTPHKHLLLSGPTYPTASMAAWRNHKLRPRESSPDERRSNDPGADLQEPAKGPGELCHCRPHWRHGIRSNCAERSLSHVLPWLSRTDLSP